MFQGYLVLSRKINKIKLAFEKEKVIIGRTKSFQKSKLCYSVGDGCAGLGSIAGESLGILIQRFCQLLSTELSKNTS